MGPMFYVPFEAAEADDSVFMASHIQDLVADVKWVIVMAIWMSRCGKTHRLVMDDELVISLTDITHDNPWRQYRALPNIYVHVRDMLEVTRLFMTRQGPSGTTSMIWDQS